MAKKIFVVVDGHNFLHRGYWATMYSPGSSSKQMTNTDGNPTAAIRGFISILLADLKHVGATHCAVVFDRPGKNFRHKLYPEYKANRPPSDIDMRSQIKGCKQLLTAMGIKVVSVKGEEGDDLIGSMAVKAAAEDPLCSVYISSNDKDFASLVTKQIKLLKPQKEVLGIKGVKEKYGVHPKQMVEYLMLLGDHVDNIPGVNKVGGKTAAKILTEHGSIDKWVPTKKTPALQRNLEAVASFFGVSRKLITIKTSCLPNFSLSKVAIKPYDAVALERVCLDLDFTTTHKQIKTTLSILQ